MACGFCQDDRLLTYAHAISLWIGDIFAEIGGLIKIKEAKLQDIIPPWIALSAVTGLMYGTGMW